MDATAVPKSKRPRSPSYPGVGLEEAIGRARVLYDRERKNSAHMDVILGHWGYKRKSGAGLVVVAALKKFGLLEDEGSGTARRARLSGLALDILLDPRPDSPERQEAIRKAALAPSIHRELWETYSGSLPSDESLFFHLVRERRFTEAGARDLIREFRASVEFAGLTAEAGTVSRQESDTGPVKEEPEMSRTAVQTPEPRAHAGGNPLAQESQRSVQLPVPGTSWVTVQADFPLTEQAWEQMMTLLRAMKPGLVESSVQSDDSN